MVFVEFFGISLVFILMFLNKYLFLDVNVVVEDILLIFSLGLFVYRSNMF